MTFPILLAWLLSLAPVPDGTRLHSPIHRPAGFARAVATVALEHPEVDARLLAATLDVLAARESNYNLRSRGDCRPYKRPGEQCTPEEHPHSCGAWSTPCAVTPMPSSSGPVPEAIQLAQARLAAATVLRSWSACPERPLSVYASGACRRVWIAEEYLRLVRVEVGAP